MLKKNVFTIVTNEGKIVYTRSRKVAERLTYNKNEIYFIDNNGFIHKV